MTQVFLPRELVPLAYAKVFQPNDTFDLTTIGKGNLQQMIVWHQRMKRHFMSVKNDPDRKGDEEEEIEVHRAKIRVLKNLKKNAVEKPIFPLFRPATHFQPDDRVVCYTAEWQRYIHTITLANWEIGRIHYKRLGSRHQINFEKRIHDGAFQNGFAITVTEMEPRILHSWEFEYFILGQAISDHSYFDLWETITESHSPTPKGMGESIRNNTILII